jgi:hypothetical protein
MGGRGPAIGCARFHTSILAHFYGKNHNSW